MRIREEAHLAQAGDDDEEQGLLMAQVCGLFDCGTDGALAAPVHLVEYSVQVNLGHEGSGGDGVWYLDTAASNHMTGDRSVFVDLDTTIGGTV